MAPTVPLNSSISKEFAYSVRCLKDSFGTARISPVLSSPQDGTTNLQLPVTLNWNASLGAVDYKLQVSTNDKFTEIIYDSSRITTFNQKVSDLEYLSTYYWRVNASNKYGTSSWSSTIWSFTTKAGPIIGVPCPGIPSITNFRNNKEYNTILIGSQCWLKENLDVGIRINGKSRTIK